jgi:polyhydroxyalkanoate synthase
MASASRRYDGGMSQSQEALEAPAGGPPPVNAPWLAWWQAQGAPALPGWSLPAERLQEIQQSYVARLTTLWNEFIEHPDQTCAPIRDARFSDPAWQKSALSSFTARTYLLNSQVMGELAASVQSDAKTRARLQFSVQQWVDAVAPSNFLALNPGAQQRVIESRGESLTRGLQNLLGDMAKGRISQVDETAFEVGRNVATSAGEVVFENELIQLLQYSPLTPNVRRRPLLLVPPCINKFYILDLQPDNSLIRYAVAQGNTVFVVSWRNPGEAQARCTWDDYLELGPIAALREARAIGVSQGAGDTVNALGFCVGGTLLVTALSVLAARGERPAATLTLLTSLVDFEDAGVLDIFIDETHVQMRERALGKGGLMPGKDLANTFSTLRANDLVWNYVVHNYLEGQSPPAFDLLYWNADSTNLPGPMYAWYLRNTYLENRLKVPGALHCCGQAVDVTTIDLPTYVFAAREDHIVPWHAAYRSARALAGVPEGALRFVLGASGHIAGTINPASRNRRSHWTGPAGPLPADPQEWLGRAVEQPGSWWPDWDRWLAGFADGERPAPASCGDERHRPIEPAPGRYVKEKA